MARKKHKALRLARRAPLLLWSAPPSVNGWSRPMIYRFADCELDEHLYQLRRNNAPVAVEPKVFDVLAYLLQHRDRVVSKDELLDKLWPGQVVGENALTRCIRAARAAVGDDGTRQEIIETQHGRGYRFIGEVVSNQHSLVGKEELTVNGQAAETVIPVQTGIQELQALTSDESPLIPTSAGMTPPLSAPQNGDSFLQPEKLLPPRRQPLDDRGSTRFWSHTRLMLIGVLLLVATGIVVHYRSALLPNTQPLTPSPQPLSLPDKPSIIVLPFINLSGDPGQEYFSDGVTEELTSTLSRVSGLFVIARTSAFSYKDKAAKVQDISREMGVRYVLEGSVQRVNGQVRITVQLIDAVTGGHVWSGRYDREIRDLFTLQDEIGQKIITALKVNLMPEEQKTFQRAPTTNLEAYDYFLRGWKSFWQDTKEANAQARQLFEQALALDPQYAGAYAGRSFTYLRAWLLQWSQDRQTLEQAFDAVQKAIALDDTLPLAYMIAASVYQKKNHYEQAIAAAERAIALDPNDANAYMALAEQLGMAGRTEEGITMAKTAMRLNPHFPPWYLLQLGSNYHQAWRNEEAIETLKHFLVYYPKALNTHIMLTCSYSDAGRIEEAREEAAEVLRLSPNFSTEVWQQNQFWKEAKEMERHLNNLRKAGLK